MTNKYQFRDYNPDGLWNWDYAIEAEVSSDFTEKYDYEYDEESSNIHELYWLHDYSSPRRKQVYNHLIDVYADRFPVWENDCISWWIHFHVFNWNFEWINWQELKYKMLNLPLHCKIFEWKLYSRDITYRARFQKPDETNDKYAFATYKSSFSQWALDSRPDDHQFYTGDEDDYEESPIRSIEFRANNVMDKRIYWYYVWMLIATKEWVKLKKTSSSLRDYVSTWDTSDHYNWWDDLHCNSIYWHFMSAEDLKVVRCNTYIILQLLRKHWLYKAAKALKEYLLSRWIEECNSFKMEDTLTWEAITSGYMIECIKINNRMHEWLTFKTKWNFYKYILKEWNKDLLDSHLNTSMFSINPWMICRTYSKYIAEKPRSLKQLFINKDVWLT